MTLSQRAVASPVTFAKEHYRQLLWVSHSGARHSQNIAGRPQIAMVVFDSTVEPGTGHRAPGIGQRVYMTATTERVTDPGAVEQGIGILSRVYVRQTGEVRAGPGHQRRTAAALPGERARAFDPRPGQPVRRTRRSHPLIASTRAPSGGRPPSPAAEQGGTRVRPNVRSALGSETPAGHDLGAPLRQLPAPGKEPGSANNAMPEEGLEPPTRGL
jgi:hypothetical protein